MRRLYLPMLVAGAVLLTVGCGRRLRWLERSPQGGTLQLHGDYYRLRPKADRLMIRQCRNAGSPIVVSESPVPPDGRVRRHIIQFQCGQGYAQPGYAPPGQGYAPGGQAAPNGDPHNPYGTYQPQAPPAGQGDPYAGYE